MTTVSTSRERFLHALDYRGPGRLPVVYHPSPAGLHVHGRQLLDLFRAFPPDNPIAFDALPSPPPGTVDAEGRYHEFNTDAWGTECEYLIFGIAGHPRRYPLAHWSLADDYRLPDVPDVSGPEFERTRALAQCRRATHVVTDGCISMFERLHALRPMDELLIDLASGEPRLLRFLERLERHSHDMIDYYLATGVDAVWFGDDWGTQTAPLVAPGMFREVFRPIYARLFSRVKQGGARVFFHSCGALGPIFEELLDLGIDLIWPQIGWFESDPARIAACRDRRVAFYVHPDRQQLVPLGTSAEIRAEIFRFAELGRRLGGGVVFYVEVENDAPFANVKALIESIAEYR